MKRKTISFLAAAFFLWLQPACTKDTGDADSTHLIGNICNYNPVYNADFAKINGGPPTTTCLRSSWRTGTITATM